MKEYREYRIGDIVEVTKDGSRLWDWDITGTIWEVISRGKKKEKTKDTYGLKILHYSPLYREIFTGLRYGIIVRHARQIKPYINKQIFEEENDRERNDETC